MAEKYGFLKVSALVFKILAWAVVILGTLAFIVILVGGGTPEAPRFTSVLALALGAIYFFVFYTASEMIKLLLDLAKSKETQA